MGTMNVDQPVTEDRDRNRGIAPFAQFPDLPATVKIIAPYVMKPVHHHLSVFSFPVKIRGGPGGDLIPGSTPDLLPAVLKDIASVFLPFPRNLLLPESAF